MTIAAYGVGSNVLQVVIIPAMGLSMAISTLVGQNIGAGNVDRAASAAAWAPATASCVLSFVGGVAWFRARPG